MFEKLQNPRGGPTLIAAGVALLALGAFLPMVAPLSGGFWLVPLALFIAGAFLIGAGLHREREARYDLRRLFEDTPPEEPYEDTVPDEGAAPYCGWCDEAYAPGTSLCRQCGRSL